jgi:ribosome recycling factor
VRNTRRDGIEAIKKAFKDGKISEDDNKKLEKDLQAQTDRIMKEIGDHLGHKEHELLKV